MSASESDFAEEMRRVAREILGELVANAPARPNGHGRPDAHARGNDHAHANGHTRSNGHELAEPPAPTPQVPAPPVAAVLRPSTWTAPSLPGEVIGDGAPATPVAPANPARGAGPVPGAGPPRALEGDDGVERVTLDSDEDLQRFVRGLATRLESPRERRAVQSGRVRFALRRTSPAPGAAGPGHTEGPEIRVAKGAVTERTVRDAAAQGARLVLARGAVLTPLARDQARALGVQIDKEGRC